MIETLTGKKIKEFRLDNNIDDKLEPFMNLCWDVGIVRHFTIRVAKLMKHTLLEKIQCILSNAGLGK